MLRIIPGSSHPRFVSSVCQHLGIAPTKTTSKLFSNGNRFVTIDEPVRGDDVFVIQTQAPPVDEHVMELLILIRALRDASASRITAVMPYMPYIRSDKKDQPRIAIAARLLADLLFASGAHRALVMDMHSPQVQGFFSTPCDQLLAAPEIVSYLKTNWNLENYYLVAGDAGAAKMLKLFADGLDLPVAIMDKRREGNKEHVTIKGVIGNVRNKRALLIDDETQSGGTLIEDAKFLLEKAGALSADACVVHAALSNTSADRLNTSPIGRIVTTDTIPLGQNALRNHETVSVTKKFAEAIHRIHEQTSIRSLNEL